MNGKHHGNYQLGGDKKTRDRMNRMNPRGNKKAGRRRYFKKMSPTRRYLSVNSGKFGTLDIKSIKTLLPNNPLGRTWGKEDFKWFKNKFKD